MIALAGPTAPPPAALWAAFALAAALLLLPDCCLNGAHAQGAGMSLFGPICRAAR